MPPTVMSVVIERSEAASLGATTSKARSQLPKIKPRTYEDGPLPIQANDKAPRNARIIARSFEGGIVKFDLAIGETKIEDVGLEEVLDYVSAYHLEEYENEQFREEEEVLRVAEEDYQRELDEEQARRKEKTKTKGVVIMQDTSDDSGAGQTNAEVEVGKHGRARPSYKPMFKKLKQPMLTGLKKRRRRKRDPRTGELLPLSGEEDEGESEQMEVESSSDDRVESRPPPSRGSAMLEHNELPKRRRRRRDPATGELLPLPPLPSESSDPIRAPAPPPKAPAPAPKDETPPSSVLFLEKTKRPRRRRHPVTKELMPLGWRFDPEAEAKIKVPSIQRLSISQENEPKRRRLERSTSTDGPLAAAPLSAFKYGDVIDLDDSESEGESPGEEEEEAQVASTPKPKLLRRSVGGAQVAQNLPQTRQESSSSSTPFNETTLPVRTSPAKSRTRLSSTSSGPDSIIPLQVDSPEASSADYMDQDDVEDKPSQTALPVRAASPAKSAPITSITHPSAVTVSSSPEAEEAPEDEEELPDDEYFVEAILAHAKSNPTTHPAHLGKKPVMLYQVRWEGFEDVTWEPITSFGDSSLDMVRAYQQRVGLKSNEVDG